MIDKAIVAAFSIIFLLVLFLSIIGMMLTFKQKIEFDQACRAALFEIDMEGGLTNEKRQELNTTLNNSGYLNVTIDAPCEVQYGEWINLKVNASTRAGWWIGFLKRREEMLYFSYDQRIVSRKIHNMAY